MENFEIGRAKRARRVYSFDDVAIVPSRRTRGRNGACSAAGLCV